MVDNQVSTVATFEDAKIIHKLRMRIIPFVFILYVISFLDRMNISFAALTMNKELAITSQQFGLVAGIFFFGYFLFEIPSNLLLHKLGARIWIARILITWGILAMLTGLVNSVHQLYAVRFLLGLAEAVYEESAFERLPILADALEDAGCTDERLLRHLREPGGHVRGCWGLDLVLGLD